MDVAMTAPTAAAAIATIIIERKDRSRMMISSYLDVIAMDLLRRPRNRWRCLLSPGEDLVLAQSRARACAIRASAPGDHSFLRCSAARNRFYSAARSAWR